MVVLGDVLGRLAGKSLHFGLRVPIVLDFQVSFAFEVPLFRGRGASICYSAPVHWILNRCVRVFLMQKWLSIEESNHSIVEPSSRFCEGVHVDQCCD